MWKFSLLYNFVNSAHTDMCDTSKESFAQGLHFFFLHLRASSNFWGRYDPKLKKTYIFPCNWVISLHKITCNASVQSSHQGIHFFSTPKTFEQFMGTLWSKTLKKTDVFPCSGVISSHRIMCKAYIGNSHLSLYVDLQGHWRSNRNLLTGACNCSSLATSCNQNLSHFANHR